jgi:hypothetical protein
MEQVLDWLNENEIRSFPLLDNSNKLFDMNGTGWLLPENFILDLQLTVKDSSLVDVNREPVPVMLSTIVLLESGTVKVSFATEEQIAEFSINSPDTQSYPLYVRSPDGNLAVFGLGVLDFVTAAAQTATALTTNIPVEPAVCVQFNGAWLGVNSLSTSPEKVSLDSLLVGAARAYEPSLPLEDTVSTTAIQGDVKFLEGYNFRIAIDSGLIDLEIASGRGLLMNCATSFLREEYLNCTDIVSYINGVPPDDAGNFRLTPGSNISITKGASIVTDFYDPASSVNHAETSNEHTLFVGFNFQATDICAPVNIIPQV